MANLGGERASANLFPSNLVHHIQGVHPQRMALRDCKNNVWYLYIEKYGDKWYFTKGWREFAKTNMIERSDVINYEYVSRGLLDVEILSLSRGRDGKKVYRKKNIKKEVEPEEVEVTQVVAVEVEHEESAAYEAEHEESATDEAKLADDGSEDVEAAVADEVDDGTGTSNHVQKKKRRRIIDFYGSDLIVSGRIRQPRHPYFVTEMRDSRVNELYIPKEILKDHNVQLPDQMLIVDSLGRKFPTTCRRWKDGRTVYFGGWNSVCKVNLAVDGDRVVCEFAPSDTDSGALQLNVIFLHRRDE